MFSKLVKSTGLVLAPTAMLVVLGFPAFGLVWLVVIGLFIQSRLSQSPLFFTDWSWAHFLLTIGFGLGLPYALLLLSAGL